MSVRTDFFDRNWLPRVAARTVDDAPRARVLHRAEGEPDLTGRVLRDVRQPQPVPVRPL